ncbi:MAG: glycosyltransferase [Ligilactobacillus agilis]|uniref:glycosyltransferase n=1 Tax=Ligilactobacillus agilis TaxID=1601 RepID=UPI00242F5FFF|nr:glycosyltransferase [Ligilactobacillus agilis]MCI5761188.1 glycosyltransferase [Ligilactobacillus agilis]
MDIAICILTKDEDKKLRRCLNSVKEVGAELIVIDSGQNESTKVICKDIGAQYHAYDWADNFALARNFAMEQTVSNNIYFLDSDEWWDAADVGFNMSQLLKYFNRPDLAEAIGTATIINHRQKDDGSEEQVGQLKQRAFNKSYFHYDKEVRVDEVLSSTLGFDSLAFNLVNVTKVHHDGFLTAESRAKKIAQKLGLALKDLEAHPGDNKYLLTLADCYREGGQMEAAELVYDQVVSATTGRDGAELYQTVIENEKLLVNSPDYHFMAGEIYGMHHEDAKAQAHFAKILALQDEGIDSTYVPAAHYFIGKLAEAKGDFETAKKHYRLSGEYPDAIDALAAIL